MRALLLIGLLAACADQTEPGQPAETEIDAVPYWGPSTVYEEDLQCRDLLGGTPDSLTDRTTGESYVSFPLQTTDGKTVTVSSAGLSIDGGVVIGKELNGTNDVTIRIDDVGSDGVTYELSYRTKDDATYKPYCAPGHVATALKGEWNSTAFRVLAERVTFGCSDSAMSKCYGFGYVPNDDPWSIPWRLHQACTRMARADICGTGEPGTRPLTPIVIRDLVDGFNPHPDTSNGSIKPLMHATTSPPPPDQHFFESAWSWEENKGAICMERDRWASVGPLTCPNLPNPHLDASGMFCNEYGDTLESRWNNIFNAGGWVVNASKTQDKFIHRWRNPATGDVVSTIRGFWRETFADPAPFPGYTQYLGQDGILLRNPPYSLTPDDVVEVYSRALGADDRALLPKPVFSTLTPSHPSFEGYLLLDRPNGGLVQFRRYTRTKADGTTDTVTSIGPPGPGWTPQNDLDFVLATPAQEVEPLPKPLP